MSPKPPHRPPDLNLSSSSQGTVPVAAVQTGDATPHTSLSATHAFRSPPDTTESLHWPRPDQSTEPGYANEPPRTISSQSSSSALDSYYFSPPSPVPQVPVTPDIAPASLPSSLNDLPVPHPVSHTPSRLEALTFDRRALVGVGELTTPRWAGKYPHSSSPWEFEQMPSPSHMPTELVSTPSDSQGNRELEASPDSPWTIEAVDGEPEPIALDGQDSPTEHIAGKARILRSSRSVASDIGGDEVLYPRRTGVVEPAVMDAIPDMPQHFPEEGQVLQIDSFEIASAAIPKELSSAENPPSPIKFGAIERDDIGTSGTTRKHRSLILPQVSANTKERRKTDLHSGRAKSFTREEHTRRASASSSSSSLEAGVAASSRRHHADYSHLPPSPSSSSIQHLLRSPPTPNSGARIKPASSPSAAAHSLLRGMQEGWSGLDDHATVEVLRKLDGVSGKSMKPRLSIGLLGTKTNSRPGTPGAKGASTNEQWEGIGSDGARAVPQRRGSSSSMKGLSSAEEVIPSTSNTPARKSSLSTNSTRSSFAKRSSAMSTAPSSVLSNESATQLTQPYVKTVRTGRSSAGSDVSGAHPDFDRIPSSTVVPTEETEVPPVPPLPKEIATATRQHGHSPELVTHDAAPSVPASPRTTEHILKHEDLQQSSLLEVRPVPVSAARSDDAISSLSSHRPRNEQPVKTPVKKWSFSSALSLRLGNSPSSTELRSAHRSSSPRQTQTRMPPTISMDSNNSALRDIDLGGSSVSLPMAANIASAPVSESARTSDSPIRGEGLFSMGNTSHSVAPPLSPASRRVSSSKRLTPSSIPFFRRSSSQAMHEIARSEEEYSPSSLPNSSDALRSPLASTDDVSLPSASQGSSKKASAFGMGLPSLLKGSVSRRSLQSEHDSTNDKSYSTRADARKSDEDAALRQLQKQERHKLKKDKSDKDRSESRISILMGRRRGKTVSSADAVRPRASQDLPPLQMPGLPAATLSRVNSIRESPSSQSSAAKASAVSSRLSAATISSLAKQAEAPRTRHNLPTIAGSPSVNAAGLTLEPIDIQSMVQQHQLPKETPTKIPRRTGSGQTASPQPSLRSQAQLQASTSRRASLNVTGGLVSDTFADDVFDEFGMISTAPRQSPKPNTTSKSLAVSVSHKQPLALSSSSKTKRDSISFGGLHKMTASNESSQSRFSALSPSKSLKFLTPKSSIPSSRLSSTATRALSPSSSRQSLSTPSPVPSALDEDEVLGDEEMLEWMKRQQSKRSTNPAKREELDDLLRVPEIFAPSLPSSTSDILSGAGVDQLSEYERKEILDYPSVYFHGRLSSKKAATYSIPTNNYGYDDERGDYLINPGDHLAYRYEIVDTLGKGSFGQVLRCKDHQTGESVAIKIIRNKKRFHHQALVEIKILDNLRKWDPDEKHYVIKMTEYFYFRNHLCIAMELLSINLYELIKANGFVGFTTTLIRRFTTQLLGSLSLMRHHRIVHCDLKPENVLLKHPAKSAIKVIDFGSSCLEHEKVYTYIQSRFYRSPEVILGMNYHMAIDMWSLGCILAELYTGFPIFPGENEQEQLSCIMEVLGPPEKELINRSSRKRLFFDSTGAPRPVVNSKGKRRRPGAKTLSQVLRCDDELFVDFVAKCLLWDPERRIKPQAAMRHPFMTALRRTRKVVSTSTSTRTLSQSGSALPASTSKLKIQPETPKKSQIGAPTPLAPRSARGSNTSVPSTPTAVTAIPSSAKASRSSHQSGTQLHSHHSSRHQAGYAVGV